MIIPEEIDYILMFFTFVRPQILNLKETIQYLLIIFVQLILTTVIITAMAMNNMVLCSHKR